MLEFKAQILPD